MYQQLAIPQQPCLPQQPLSSPITFTQDEPIDDAFIKLSAYVAALIQHTNFQSLQRACIEKATSSKMLHKSNKIVPVIKEAQSFHTLCSMLADTTYWNILDTRMMEAMATASMIPAAQVAIENFKKTFYNMTLKEAAPYFPVTRFKPGYTTMHEDLDRDPSQMTIGELHKHRFYIEKEIVQNGPDTCTIYKIIIGSVKIDWKIHVNHAYKAYTTLKRSHSQLSSQTNQFISIPEIEHWEGLPFLWRGQDVDEVGPIESLNSVKHEPYPLPQGFEWCTLNSNHFNEIIQLSKDVNPINPMARSFLKWFISCPQYKKRYLSGIRLSSSKKLVWVLTCIPYTIRVEEKLLSMVKLQQTAQISPDTENWLNQLSNSVIKESMRVLASEGIFQALIFMNLYIIPKPVITFNVYFWDSHLQPLPYTTPRTVGLRKMKTSDIPKAFTLANQYTSRFKIGQVFKSEEEFSHWFLSPLVDNIATYVVEEPTSGNITDIFSYRTLLRPGCDNKEVAEVITEVIAMVITSSRAEQLITDLLVCAKQQNRTFVVLPRFGLKEDIFKNLLKQPSITNLTIQNQGCCLFYNYRYPEVDDDNHCLFGSRLHSSII